MEHIVFALFVIMVATLFALIEIQIEGADGWAEKLPTWRVKNKLTQFFLGGRPLTGYHLFFFSFILSVAHLPYGLGFLAPTWAAELRIAAFIIFFFIVEDFLWFVLNPAFGLSKFKASQIWWHTHSWWWIMPRDYWIFGPIALGLYILSWVR